MTVRMSSGLRHAVVTNYGVGMMMNGGYIQVFSGGQPPSADDQATGTLLGFITQDGLPLPLPGDSEGGLQLRGGRIGEIVNDGNWVLKCVTAGAPGWWRFVSQQIDPGVFSQSAVRIDGCVGDSLFEIPPSLTAQSTTPVAGFTLRFLS